MVITVTITIFTKICVVCLPLYWIGEMEENKMKAKLIVNNQEIEVEISEEEYKKLQPEKKTGYERVLNQIFYWATGDGKVFSCNDNCEISDAGYEAANYYSSKEIAENKK